MENNKYFQLFIVGIVGTALISPFAVLFYVVADFGFMYVPMIIISIITVISLSYVFIWGRKNKVGGYTSISGYIVLFLIVYFAISVLNGPYGDLKRARNILAFCEKVKILKETNSSARIDVKYSRSIQISPDNYDYYCPKEVYENYYKYYTDEVRLSIGRSKYSFIM